MRHNKIQEHMAGPAFYPQRPPAAASRHPRERPSRQRASTPDSAQGKTMGRLCKLSSTYVFEIFD